MLLHASEAFPSHWIPVLEVALSLVAGVVLLALPGLGGAMAARGLAWLERLGPGGTRAAALGLALAAAAASAAVTGGLGFPVPRVSDEFGHLLVADTLASGRLANPPLGAPEGLAAVHVIAEPSHAAKYPPAPGALLALGQRLGGHPGVGLWLGAALLAGVAAWVLASWLPGPWALFGSLLVAVRLGIGSYWGQSYWGGTAAAVGGGLWVAGVHRWVRRPAAGLAVPIAAGAWLLAASRPFEGLLFALPGVVALTGSACRAGDGSAAAGAGQGRSPRDSPARAWAALLLLSAALATGLALYDEAVTGDALTLPYLHYDRQHEVPANLVWQDGAPAPGTVAADLWRRWSGGLAFVLGFPLLAAPLGLLRGGAWRRHPLLLATLAAGLVASALTAWWFPHYAAPVALPLWALALLGLRALCPLVVRGRVVTGQALVALVAVQLALAAVQLPGHRPDPGDWSRRRQALERGLAEIPGRDLVFVAPGFPAHQTWVAHGAAPATGEVVWAHDLGEAGNRQVIGIFPGRRAWRLDPEGREATPRLVPVARPDG